MAATAHSVRSPSQVPEPPLARFLFADTRMAWFWLIVRVYCGWEWLDAGWAKLQNPAWFGSGAGGALRGFVNGALQKTSGDHPQRDRLVRRVPAELRPTERDPLRQCGCHRRSGSRTGVAGK